MPPNPSPTDERLLQYIAERMRKSPINQPLMLMELLGHGFARQLPARPWRRTWPGYSLALPQGLNSRNHFRQRLLTDQQHLFTVEIEVLMGNHIAKPHGTPPIHRWKVGLQPTRPVAYESLECLTDR
jgi:hypothetical protein